MRVTFWRVLLRLRACWVGEQAGVAARSRRGAREDKKDRHKLALVDPEGVMPTNTAALGKRVQPGHGDLRRRVKGLQQVAAAVLGPRLLGAKVREGADVEEHALAFVHTKDATSGAEGGRCVAARSSALGRESVPAGTCARSWPPRSLTLRSGGRRTRSTM